MGKKSKRRGKQKTSMNRQNVQQAAVPQSINGMPPGYGRVHTIPNPQPIQMPFVTDSLVTAIFGRGGLPQHLNSFESLQKCLSEAFVGVASLIDFFQALAEGLETGAPQINQPVELISNTSGTMSLLHWVCQYEFLNLRLDCNLSEDIVRLVLKAGADPNALRQDNQATPLFFAVKYTSPEVIDMLLEAGANIHHCDNFGHTCLKNALEHPKPMVIRRLLEFLPATEMINSSDGRENFLVSAADIMLSEAAAGGGVPPQSWVTLGVPAASDFAEAFMMIRQNGARLTQRSNRPIRYVTTAIKSPTHPQIKHPELLLKLAEVLVGTYIPERCLPKKEGETESDTGDIEQDGEPRQCPICLEDVRKSVILYCGHTFCRECILEHGKFRESCPMCRVLLSLDVSKNRGRGLVSNIMGVDQKALEMNGPKFFTNEQVEAEAKAQGIYNNFSSCERFRENLETAIENGIRSSQEAKSIELDNIRNVRDGSPSPTPSYQGRGRYKLELASNFSQALGSPTSTVNFCPTDGMVSIEVSISGIPLLARISNQSLYTVLCRSMVDQLGLKRIDTLKSRKFVDLQCKKFKNGSTFTCLEPVKICFQGIEVILRNAIEIFPDPEPFMTTVQLGQDFLRSGWLSIIDVKTGDEGSYYRVVAEDSWPVSGISRESFRFYSHDGKMADLPLIHFDPFIHAGMAMILGITVRAGTKFNECHWCCRIFPEGMLSCAGCEQAYYCDERCERAAWKIHKLACGVASRES